MQPAPVPGAITFTATPQGHRTAVAHFPLAAAMRARHLPTLEHNGIRYVPYTGEVVAPYRGNVTSERPVGYYMEYRALCSTPAAA